MNDQKEDSIFQPKEPGMLESVSQGNEGAAETMFKLVEKNCLKPVQLPQVLEAAVKGGANNLAKLAACRISILAPELVQEMHRKLTSILKDPDGVSHEEIRTLVECARIYIGEGIIRNGKILEIAEAIADGLAITKDADKRKTMKTLGENVRAKMPDELEWIYGQVYELSERPRWAQDCYFNVALSSRLKRLENGDANLARVVNDVVAERMRKTLKPLSDGDMSLPRPLAMRPRRQSLSMMDTIAQLGRKIAEKQKLREKGN